MRPAIARLISPVYPHLSDHPDVEAYPPPKGVASPLFFVTHGYPETFDPESRSRSNDHEASYLTALAVFLLRSGYQASQITVLTTYCGQLFSLRKRFRAPGGERGLDEIRLCTVDQYQGEENDVILLSLVRSNQSNDIGFLSVQNRMVVALSRAKHCLFIVGNAHLLAARSNLWCSVLSHLEQICCLGPALPVLVGGAKFLSVAVRGCSTGPSPGRAGRVYACGGVCALFSDGSTPPVWNSQGPSRAWSQSGLRRTSTSARRRARSGSSSSYCRRASRLRRCLRALRAGSILMEIIVSRNWMVGPTLLASSHQQDTLLRLVRCLC